MKEKLAFAIGTGALLLGIALVVNGIERVQSGPDWEVPAAAMGQLLWGGIISVFLYLIEFFSYVRGSRFASQTAANRVGFWVLLCLGVVLTVLSYAFGPEQWRVTHSGLSALASKSSLPVSIACGLIWVLLIIRGRPRSSPPSS